MHSKVLVPCLTSDKKAEVNPNIAFYETIASIYDRIYGDVDADEAVRQWSLLVRRCAGLPAADQTELPRLLDVGCGTGRYLIPWAAAGFRVTGIDASKGMTARATARLEEAGWASRIRLICGDVRRTNPTLNRHGPFGVAVAHFNFLNLFPPGELAEVLRSLRGCLDRGCRLFADAASPSFMPARESERLDLGAGMAIEVETCPDRASGTVARRYHYDETRTEEKYWLHSTTTLTSVAKAAGWRLASIHAWRPHCRREPWPPRTKSPAHRVFVFRAGPR